MQNSLHNDAFYLRYLQRARDREEEKKTKLTLIVEPVVDRLGRGLDEAFEHDVGPERCADQLIRHVYHWRNCREQGMVTRTTCIYTHIHTTFGHAFLAISRLLVNTRAFARNAIVN